MENFETKKTEVLGDKEKLEEVQDFVKDMNEIGFDRGDRKIKKGDTILNIESVRGDGGSYVKINLVKNGKEVFNYDMSADSFREGWKVGVTTKVDGKIMSYNGDENNEHGVYNNYNLLEKAKTYQKEILEMIEIENNKKKEAQLKKQIKR